MLSDVMASCDDVRENVKVGPLHIGLWVRVQFSAKAVHDMSLLGIELFNLSNKCKR